MVNLYFRNTGSTSWNTATNWSLSNGGPADGTVPLATDNVFVTALSGNIATASGAVCASLNFTGFTGTFSGGSAIAVSGNITFSPAMTITSTGQLQVNAAATLISAGKTWPGALTLNAPVAVTYTLADDWRVTGTFSSTIASKVINGFKIYAGGQFAYSTGGTTTSGTTEIVMNGTGIFTGSSSAVLQNNLTIDTTGTITLNPTSTPYNTGTFRYIRGTVITTGNTMTCALPTTFDTNTLVWNNVTFSSASNYTFLSDFIVNGTFTSSGAGTKTINGSTLYLKSNLAFTTNSSVTEGTTNFVLNGTGNWSGGQTRRLRNNLTIDTTGTITQTTGVAYDGGTLRKINGSYISTGQILFTTGNTVVDMPGVILEQVTVLSTVTGTLTLASLLQANTLLLSTGAVITFAGPAAFLVNTLNCDAQTSAAEYSLTPGLLYRITNAFTGFRTDASKNRIFNSSVAGTKATLTLDIGATCNVGYVNFTDIDAGGGRAINTFNGDVTNCINVNSYVDPIRTISKSFAA